MSEAADKMAPVEQCDREAAADAVKAYRDQRNHDWQARIRRGECDDGYMVQSYARHRLAALQSPRPVGGECAGCEGKPAPENNPCAVCGHPAPSPVSADVVETLAEAVYAAEDTQSGDTIGTVIWNSDHLFYEHVEGEEVVDRAKRASMPTCRDAVRAVLTALRSLPEQDRRHEG